MSFYKFKTNNPIVFQTEIKNRAFKNDWIEINKSGQITVSKNYAWDGCSPKFNCLDLTIGTPDGRMVDCIYPITWYASLIHDACYQFKKEIPLTRKEVDVLFLNEMIKQDFKLKYVYYYTVRLLGGIMGKWNYKKNDKETN